VTSTQEFPAPNAKRRRKSVAKAQQLLGARGTCRMYGFGVVGPDPQRSLLIMIGAVVGTCVVVAALTGAIVFPGILVIAVVRWLMNTPRGVAVADQGIAVTKESLWNASPSDVVAQLPLEQIFVVVSQTKTHVCVQLGNDQVWLRRKEHEILVAAVQNARMQAAHSQPAY
jgi:hypothetical protein